MHVFHRLNFIIKIGEHFFTWINQFISRVQKFYFITFEGKVYEYFSPEGKHYNLKSPEKNLNRLCFTERFNSSIKVLMPRCNTQDIQKVSSNGLLRKNKNILQTMCIAS